MMLASASSRTLVARCGPRSSVLSRRFLNASALVVQETTSDARFDAMPAKEALTFGTTTSDHILTVEYKDGEWKAPSIKPYGNLSISPAASSLHYGIQCFEGLKAYKSSGGEIRLFRPDKNIQRLKNSMERLQMPGWDFDPENFLQLLKKLVELDQRWIPTGEGYSLYIRPTVIATHPYLGLAAPTELMMYIITSPVGPYYPTGFKPISLLATSDHIRAWPGGTGNHKVGGNYAPTMKPQSMASAQGYSQVLWLFGEDDEITEVGSMNIFFVFGGSCKPGVSKPTTLVTPPLDRGDILPGVTRDSILQLARASGEWVVEERSICMQELIERKNELKEAFGAGTAAVVTPISNIAYNGEDIDIPVAGKWTQRFWDDITGIQYGKQEGPEGWSVVV